MFVIPYMLPMLLGRTFNYNKAQVGVDIFNKQELDAHKVIINRHFTQSRFRLIRSTKDADELLDIKGELSLKVMGDMVNVQASGSYLKDKADRETTVEVLCRVKYETVTETLDTSIEPLATWRSYDDSALGSHYIRSVTYGGELVASVKFRAASKKDAKRVAAAVSVGVGVEGTLNIAVGGRFESIREKLDGSVSIDVKYYATVPVRGVPQDIKGLQKLISGFAKHVQAVGNGKGNPINVEIFPLSSLTAGSNIATFMRNAAVSSKLQEVQEKYDDVLTARQEFTSWVSRLNHFGPEVEQVIATFHNELRAVSESFYRVIVNLEIDQNARSDQFAPAITAYRGTDSFVLPGKFMRAFRKLKLDVNQELFGIGACVFGPPLVDAGILRDNKLLTANTKDVTASLNTTNIAHCKRSCVTDKTCTSITYLLARDSDGVKEGKSDKCFVNLVQLSSTRLIRLPRGPTDPTTLVFVRNKQGQC